MKCFKMASKLHETLQPTDLFKYSNKCILTAQDNLQDVTTKSMWRTVNNANILLIYPLCIIILFLF